MCIPGGMWWWSCSPTRHNVTDAITPCSIAATVWRRSVLYNCYFQPSAQLLYSSCIIARRQCSNRQPVACSSARRWPSIYKFAGASQRLPYCLYSCRNRGDVGALTLDFHCKWQTNNLLLCNKCNSRAKRKCIAHIATSNADEHALCHEQRTIALWVLWLLRCCVFADMHNAPANINYPR